MRSMARWSGTRSLAWGPDEAALLTGAMHAPLLVAGGTSPQTTFGCTIFKALYLGSTDLKYKEDSIVRRHIYCAPSIQWYVMFPSVVCAAQRGDVHAAVSGSRPRRRMPRKPYDP